MRKTNASRFF